MKCGIILFRPQPYVIVTQNQRYDIDDPTDYKETACQYIKNTGDNVSFENTCYTTGDCAEENLKDKPDDPAAANFSGFGFSHIASPFLFYLYKLYYFLTIVSIFKFSRYLRNCVEAILICAKILKNRLLDAILNNVPKGQRGEYV